MKKQILFIHESFACGGAEKVLIDILRNFDYESYSVTLLIEKGMGVHLKSIPEQVETLELFPKSDFKYRVVNHFRSIRDHYLSRKIDALLGTRHFHTIISFMEGPAAYLHQFMMHRAERNISWVHTNLAENHWSAYLFGGNLKAEADLYAKMDNVVFVSAGARDSFCRYLNYSGSTEVVYNIIPIHDIEAMSHREVVPTQRFTICTIGRLTEPKRQDRFIDVIASLRRRGLDCEGWILGDGALRSTLRQHAADAGVSNDVKFLGFQANPYTYLRASDLFLLTSDVEGYSLVVAEAMCVGKPIVSTAVTGPDELLANGVGVLTSTDTEEIADRVQELAADPERRAALARSARQAAIGRFDPEAVMARIYSLL